MALRKQGKRIDLVFVEKWLKHFQKVGSQMLSKYFQILDNKVVEK